MIYTCFESIKVSLSGWISALQYASVFHVGNEQKQNINSHWKKKKDKIICSDVSAMGIVYNLQPTEASNQLKQLL